MGADPIALAVACIRFGQRLATPENILVRKTPKGHGQTKLIEGNFKPGDLVAVLDEVVTSVTPTISAIRAVGKKGKSRFVAVLVIASKAAARKLKKSAIALNSASNAVN